MSDLQILNAKSNKCSISVLLEIMIQIGPIFSCQCKLFQVNNSFSALEDQYPFKRSADGSKRIRVPHSLSQVTRELFWIWQKDT